MADPELNSPVLLESHAEYRKRCRSLYVIYFTTFLMALGFSIVITGVWPYLDKLDPKAGKEFMGLIVAANPLAQTIFSPIVGYWGNRLGSIRIPMLVTLTIFTMASAIYSSLEILPNHHKYWMFGSRFLVGVSAANMAVCRSYISSATKLEERTKAVSMVSLMQVLGFIIGPAMQAAVTMLGDPGVILVRGMIHMNMYTAAGWINVLLGMINFAMFMPSVFEEKHIAARELMLRHGKTTERETWKALKPNKFGAITLIVAFFVLVFNFVLLETLGTSMTMDQFAWTKKEALEYIGIIMAVGGVIAFVTFVLISPLCRWFDERKVLIWGGFFLMVVGRVVHIPWGDHPPRMAMNETELATHLLTLNASAIAEFENVGCTADQDWCRTTRAMTLTQFVAGYAVTSVGYPIGVTLIQTIFSKILGPRPQGTWMGIMTGSGSLSRVLGPIFVGSIYTRLGTNWTFGITSVMMALSMIWLFVYYKQLQSPTTTTAMSTKEDDQHGTEMKVVNGGSALKRPNYDVGENDAEQQQKERLLIKSYLGEGEEAGEAQAKDNYHIKGNS